MGSMRPDRDEVREALEETTTRSITEETAFGELEELVDVIMDTGHPAHPERFLVERLQDTMSELREMGE